MSIPLSEVVLFTIQCCLAHRFSPDPIVFRVKFSLKIIV